MAWRRSSAESRGELGAKRTGAVECPQDVEDNWCGERKCCRRLKVLKEKGGGSAQ